MANRVFLLSLIIVSGFLISACGVSSGSASGSSSNAVGGGSSSPGAAPSSPTSLALQTPTYSPSNNKTPIITVGGVVSGDTVKIFSDSMCTTQLASGVAAGTTINLTTSALAAASYTIYANSTNTVGSSSCSTVNVSYQATNTAPNYVSSASTAAPGATTFTVTKPAGLAVGDLMISLIYNTSNMAGLVGPSGFTFFSAAYNVSGSYYSRAAYKVADAADVAAANFTFTLASGFGGSGLMMFAFRGAHPTSPIQDYTTALTTGSTSINYNSATAASTNNLIVALGESSTNPGAPAGYTSRFTDATLGTTLSDRTQAAAGATGALTSTAGGTYDTAGSLFVLNAK